MRRRVGTITKCQCQKCGHIAERFVAADNRCSCDKCEGGVMIPGTAATQRFYGNRRFHGEEGMSVTEGFRSYEVPLARKHITAGTIHDDGRVSFADRADQRKFMQQQARLRDGLIQTLGTED